MPYLFEELSPEERAKLPAKDFVFPKSRTWPIQDIEQAKTALTYASWPKNRDAAASVRAAVFKRYPELKGWATVGKSKYKAPWQKKKGRKQESIGSIGEIPGISDRLGALSDLLGDSQVGVNHDPRGIGRTDGILEGNMPLGQFGYSKAYDLFIGAFVRLSEAKQLMEYIPKAENTNDVRLAAAEEALKYIKRAITAVNRGSKSRS